METRGTSLIARVVSNVVIGVIGGLLVTQLFKAFGMKRMALAVATAATMVVIHEQLDTPLARMLSRVQPSDDTTAS